MVPIKAIDPTSIHRITSGQVVIDLQTAVKELVENSLDAGSTSIEVRFKDYGLKSIEVIDNGHGVAEDDYDKIGMKHHTSKLASFEDLGSVLTFGFRGEALSSLCALSSSVAVTTATAEHAPMGTVLEFDRSGKVKDNTGRTARKRGTTVMITGLFSPLPVRRKEFERNAKREFGKALMLLHAYALVPCSRAHKGVRLTVSNHPDRGTRSVQIRTDGIPSLKAAVSTLWGPKSLDNVVPLDLHLEVEVERPSVLKKRGILQDGATSVEVKGLMSKFAPGCGRTSTDRQFFYINGRPCNPNKVQKVFNEVYRTFNANQVPFVIADFQLPTNACDINVSPDKRTIFIHSENNLILELKAKLEEAFSPSRSTFPVNSVASATQDMPRSRDSGMERGSSPVTGAAGSSSDLGHREINEPVKVTGDPPRGESAGTSARQMRDRGMKAGQREEANLQIDLPTQARSARGRQNSRLHSQSSSTAEPIIDGMDADHEDELENTLDSQDVPPDNSNSALDAAPLAPSADVSMSTDVNRDIESLSDREEPDHDTDAARSRPHTPLFVPSPSPSPVIVTEATTSSTSNYQGKETPVSASPRSPEPDDGQERPRKRARMSLPGAAGVPPKAHPVQMVLGTKGAAWNLQVQDEGSRVATGDRAKSTTSRSKEAGARTKIRSRLDGYAMPGSQVRPIEVDNDECSDSDSGVQGETMEVEEAEVNDKTQDITSESQTEGLDGADILVRDAEDEASQNASSAADTEPFVVDSTDNRGDDDGGSAPIQEHASEGLVEDGSFPEVIRTTSGATLTLRFDLDRVTSTWSRLHTVSSLSSTLPAISSDSQGLGATANVANADDAEGAERELARVIHKEDFASMHILGQFNLGFIITRRLVLNKVGQSVDDLFIVDQHAADEKYNFETLQQTTKIESQKLFQPRPLELTAADELVAIENVDVLRSNGFEVIIDDEARAGHGERVKLVAQPVSKSTTFTVKDLEELLHLMQDQPCGQMVRCSKARAMFAMRACRKSVMIGMPLTIGQMTSVVRHMGTMEQPWNCPHGRPTMRHLVSLTAWHRNRKMSREVDWDRFAI